jgi:enoyl-CoA hydratase/carnithine racemase
MPLIDTRYSHDHRVGHVILNRADKANALTQSMWQALHAAVTALATEEQVRVIAIESATPKAFSAGADIAELREMLLDPGRFEDNHAIVQKAQMTIYRCPKPTVAKIRGACVGGGLGIALACDFRVADTTARFALTPARLGLSYSLSDSLRLHRLVGAAAARSMLLLGETLTAERALALGLLHQLHAENVDAAVDALLATLASSSRVSMQSIKATLLKIEAGQIEEDVDSMKRFADAFHQPDFAHAAACFFDKTEVKF